jgi:hypothetical protein
MADANNGYKDQFDEAWNLLAKTSQDDLYWMEELFPESVTGYSRLKDKIAEASMKTLNADGENFSKPAQFEEYLHPRRLIDVLQLDTRRGGSVLQSGNGGPNHFDRHFRDRLDRALHRCRRDAARLQRPRNGRRAGRHHRRRHVGSVRC